MKPLLNRISAWVATSAVSLFLTGTVCAAPITINLWHVENPEGPGAKQIKKMTDAYNAANPGVKVVPSFIQFSETGDFLSKVSTAIAAGVGPDIVEISGNWLGAIGGVLPLEQYVAKSKVMKMEDFYPSQFYRAMLDGHVYGVPNHTDSRLLFYNVDLFDQAGLGKPPETWDQAYDLSKKLMKSDGNRLTQIGLVPSWGQGWFYLWAATNNVRILNYDWWLPKDQQPAQISPQFNTPGGEAVMDFMSKFYDLYGGSAALSQYTSALKGHSFVVGAQGMYVDGSWNLPYWTRDMKNIKWSVAPIPHGPSGQRSTLAGGFNWEIPKGSEHPDEAFKVIEYITNTENNVAFCAATGLIPVRRQALSNPVYLKDQVLRAFVMEMEYAQPFPEVPFSSDMWDAVNIRARDAAISKTLAPKAALDTAAREVQAAIERTIKR